MNSVDANPSRDEYGKDTARYSESGFSRLQESEKF